MFLRTLAFFTLSAAAFLSSSVHAPAVHPTDPIRTDVVVVGGTPAGIAASLAAARRGESVVLVSARPYLGGVLSGALMDQWDLNVGPHGTSVEAGIFREMHRKLGDAFTARMVERTFAGMVAAQSNIRLIPDAALASVKTSRIDRLRRIDEVAFALPGGRTASIVPQTVVDATDDGDVAAAAGARYDVGRQDAGRDTRMQAATLMFTVRGVDWTQIRRSYTRRRFGPGGTSASRAWGYIALLPAYTPSSPDVLVRDLNMGRERDGTVTVNAIDIFGVDGRSVRSVGAAERIARAETPPLVRFLRAHLPGFERARVSGFAPELYVRETRHIYGMTVLRSADIWHGTIPHDAIGLASYPLDLHPVARDDRPTFATVRHVYGVPFRALVPRGFANVLIASRAISATHFASASARIVPTTVEEGEAAGAACALARASRLTFPAVATFESARLRADLAAHGVVLTPPEAAGDADGDASLGKLRIVRSRERTANPAD